MTTAPPSRRPRAPRLDSIDRERMIVSRAVEFFADHGFSGSTRDLTKAIGITQSLLYRYFPSKKALLERVYDTVTLARWNPVWDDLIVDRSLPIADRLRRFYVEYARLVLSSEWVRILIFAGLEKTGVNERLFAVLKERVFRPVTFECFAAFCPEADDTELQQNHEMELELIWGLHASIFYIGMRQWVYATMVPRDIDATITALVNSFLAGMQDHLRRRFEQQEIQHEHPR